MEYDDQSTDNDTQSYMCFPLSQIEKSHLEAGNNIIMPASALSSSSQKLVCRMTFRIAKSNDTSTLHYHCGVAEFTADDGFAFLPTWMMKKLNIREGDLVNVKNTSLPEGNYIKVQPHTTEFITNLSDPISVLKKALRDHVACLISGDSVVVNHKENEYLIHIVETKPSGAISLFENDNYEVEFAKPLDYYKQPKPRRFPHQGSGEILEEDDTIYQPVKKKLRLTLSSVANKQQTKVKPFTGQSKLPDNIIRKILLVAPKFHAIVDSEPCGGDVVKLDYPFECQKKGVRYIRVIGTFSGIVVLVVNNRKNVEGMPKKLTSRIILYNPLTHESEILPDPYSPFYEDNIHKYGFGYGATKDDLKIVRFRGLTEPDNNWNICDVFNLKERSWSTSEILIKDANFWGDDVGTFLNGSLYWFALNKIVALNVNEMVISEIHLPFKGIKAGTHLGTLHGCLWMITKTDRPFRFNMWVMKTEQGVKISWSESRSLILHLEYKYCGFLILNLMDDGRILMMGGNNELIICDTSKDTYKVLSGGLSNADSINLNAIEYEESLLSPSII
ncbi:ubiquitin fusion degradation protein UFD1 [Artemisia annua]|uniref:Ubiquitin fusion degradation protein UFD1 n=1 Tax=Artemisia annua TaxID=35608 RepID=A0A2U1QA99_ARTAN|nr:ubiquitin fusion degradation protein UFD1 [Artemisia annua]